jgi:hypothetical protein
LAVKTTRRKRANVFPKIALPNADLLSKKSALTSCIVMCMLNFVVIDGGSCGAVSDAASGTFACCDGLRIGRDVGDAVIIVGSGMLIVVGSGILARVGDADVGERVGKAVGSFGFVEEIAPDSSVETSVSDDSSSLAASSCGSSTPNCS